MSRELGDAQLFAQAGQAVAHAAGVLTGFQVFQERRLHLLGHVQLGLAQRGLVAVGLQGGLLVGGEQAEALEDGLGHFDAPAVDAHLGVLGAHGGGRIALALGLGGGIAHPQTRPEGTARGFSPFFGGTALGVLRPQAGVEAQGMLHGIGHADALARHGPVRRLGRALAGIDGLPGNGILPAGGRGKRSLGRPQQDHAQDRRAQMPDTAPPEGRKAFHQHKAQHTPTPAGLQCACRRPARIPRHRP